MTGLEIAQYLSKSSPEYISILFRSHDKYFVTVALLMFAKWLHGPKTFTDSQSAVDEFMESYIDSIKQYTEQVKVSLGVTD